MRGTRYSRGQGLFSWYEIGTERLHSGHYESESAELRGSTRNIYLFLEMPLIEARHPAGISSRQPKHFIQLTDCERALHHVRPLTPAYIFYSDEDFSTSKQDAENLAFRLRKSVVHRISKTAWHHMNFLHALTVAEVINKPIIEIFKEFDQLYDQTLNVHFK
ncbi:uncharacterized protein LOC119560222 [Drosophila subpulchrella]|uniref:uncharacterized protein LOC119560222 n=1 Tax=Drosophila subpulchrella TaxID=1486046 RepID=UPI0018A16478|nr:uncharacterized protein LOC119560222 [Drosophila subpulchrella]